MPQDDLVERVARAICAAFDASDVDEFDRSLAHTVVALVREAEPLTTTLEPKTTETEREAPINQDPPPGFEYEYRAVIDTRVGKSYDDWTLSRERAEENAKWAANWVIERRLAGPPERVEGDE